MGPANYGARVQILGQVSDWFVVKLPDGRTGWVADNWISSTYQ
jgi:hypothetical protein